MVGGVKSTGNGAERVVADEPGLQHAVGGGR